MLLSEKLDYLSKLTILLIMHSTIFLLGFETVEQPLLTKTAFLGAV